MEYKEIVNYLNTAFNHNIEHSELKEILKKYDLLNWKQPIIHITGTNGKGTTAQIIHKQLIENGYRVGLFTSPHLNCYEERIVIDKEKIKKEDFISIFNDFREEFINHHLGMFEILFFMALWYFRHQKCDVLIIEVGIGGLKDVTNFLDANIAVITTISLDHQKMLGTTINEITDQKKAIIKKNSKVVTGALPAISNSIIKKYCKKQQADLYQVTNSENDYLLHNAKVAEQVINLFNLKFNWDLFYKQTFAGRKEIISTNPLIIVDGAHNIAGIKSILNEIDHNTLIIAGICEDKDYLKMIELMKIKAKSLYLVGFDNPRSLIKKPYDFNEIIKLINNHNEPILFCGSLYFIAEIREKLLAYYSKNSIMK